MHPRYANDPQHYLRAAFIILKDLQELFDYVEPADLNLPSYSYRIHELLLRACVEIEANCKAILLENGYRKSGRWDITDYRKTERSHLLSQFEVKFPLWRGSAELRRPFKEWAAGNSPAWYDAYNESKHNRHHGFEKANLQHMTDAVCGLFVLLSAQFWTHDFVPESNIVAGGIGDGFDPSLGGFFRIRFPDAVPDAERYHFNWDTLSKEPDPFQSFPY